MIVKDLYGCIIEVVDLNDAIHTVKVYMQYEHENKGFSKLDKKLNQYWTDLYEKLSRMKNNLSTDKNI